MNNHAHRIFLSINLGTKKEISDLKNEKIKQREQAIDDWKKQQEIKNLPIIIGGDKYYLKYLKYKTKYLHLYNEIITKI